MIVKIIKVLIGNFDSLNGTLTCRIQTPGLSLGLVMEFPTFFYYSKLLNESTGTLKKYPPKIQAVRTFFAVLLQLFQVNGVLEN